MAKWYKGAKRYNGKLAQVMDKSGGNRKVVIHTEGVNRGKDGDQGNAYAVAEYVRDRNIGYHILIDRSGRIAQLYPANKGARSMKSGAWSPNRQGERAIQVCFVGVVSMSQVKKWPMKNWAGLLDWLEKDQKIPRKSLTKWKAPTRSETKWRDSGWTCHAAAPFNDHTDGKSTPIEYLWSFGSKGNAKQPKPEESGSKKKYRVVVDTKGGARWAVGKNKLGKFTTDWDKVVKGRFTAEEAEEAKAWAAKKYKNAKKIWKQSESKRTHLYKKDSAKYPKDSALNKHLDRCGRRMGRRVYIVSGYRSYAEQEHLYRLYLAGKGNLAAAPNANAPHIRGIAADCGVITKGGNYLSFMKYKPKKGVSAAQAAAKEDLVASVPGEPWHLQRKATLR